MMQYKKKVINKRYVVALTVAMAFAAGIGIADAATKDIDLVKSWNLVNTPLEPTTPAIDSVLTGQDYATAWAWDAAAGKWKVRLGSESGSAIGTYAASKGFSSLTEIHAGQGFWLNMNAAGKLTINGSAPANTTNALVAGWNLIGSKYNQVKSTAEVVAALGAAQVKPLSLWKWQGGNWAVALPYNTDGTPMADGGAAYATSKGFATLSAVAATDGYWVNTTTGGSPTDTPPEVGKVYKTTGANTYVPLANAPVKLNGDLIGTTDANGNFPLPANLNATDVITVGSGNEYTVSASTLTGGELYMFAQDQDANKVTLTQADIAANKPTPKKICSGDGRACITISNMQLTKDITVAVTPYESPLSIPSLAQIKSLDPNYKAVAGADVIFTDSLGDNISESAAGFQGTVVPMAANFITELTGANLDDYLTNGIGSADLLEYNDGVWAKIGAAEIIGVVTKTKVVDDKGTTDTSDDTVTEADGPKAYTLKGTAGTVLSGLKPFAFAFKTEYMKGTVQVTVTNKGILYKSANGDNLVTTNTEGQGSVLDESYDSPVAGALVTTDNSDAFVTTAADGTATIEYILPPDNPILSLLIKKDGYFDGTSTFNVIEDTAKTVDFLEVPATAAVGGVIKNAETKVGIPGAQVTLKNPVVLDKIGEEDGTIMVGLDSDATYLWEISKQGTDVWVPIVEGVGKNSITQQDIKTSLITNFNTFISYLTPDEKAALGQNPVGTYEVRITVTHPYSNLNYVESATGYLDVTFDLGQLEKTASISQSQLGQISVFGGNDIGFYYATAPIGTGGTFKWTVSLNSWDDVNSDGVVDDGEVTTLAHTDADALQTPFFNFIDAINLVQSNYLTLLQDGQFQEPGQEGKSYLEAGISIKIQIDGTYVLGTLGLQEKSSFGEFDITNADPLAPLTVGKFQVLPNTTMAFEEMQETDDNGSYLFPFVDPQLNGMLGLSAAADAYYPNNLFLDDTNYELLVGWITPADLELTPVLTVDMPPTIGSTATEPEPDKTNVDITGFPEPTGWLETFEAAVPDGTDSSLFTTAANNGQWKVEGAVDEGENTVKWWALDTPEVVGPAQGGIQYPLIDANADGTADDSAGAMLLPAYDGTGVAWFGNTTTATFSNNATNYSSGAKSGVLTSPVIDLADYSFVTLDFASWFEVESVDVAKWQYDQMKVEVCLAPDAWPTEEQSNPTPIVIGDYSFTGPTDCKIVTFMNPDSEAAIQQADINFSSGGNDAVPIWIKKQANLNPFAGQKIVVRFNFQSQDSLYNGGRGWAVDNVAILNGDSGLPFTLEQSNYWWKAPTRKP